jgi:hypothetical protein
VANDDEQAHGSGRGYVEPLWVSQKPKRVPVTVVQKR